MFRTILGFLPFVFSLNGILLLILFYQKEINVGVGGGKFLWVTFKIMTSGSYLYTDVHTTAVF